MSYEVIFFIPSTCIDSQQILELQKKGLQETDWISNSVNPFQISFNDHNRDQISDLT